MTINYIHLINTLVKSNDNTELIANVKIAKAVGEADAHKTISHNLSLEVTSLKNANTFLQTYVATNLDLLKQIESLHALLDIKNEEIRLLIASKTSEVSESVQSDTNRVSSISSSSSDTCSQTILEQAEPMLAKCRDNTRRTYTFHLRALKSFDDVDEWLQSGPKSYGKIRQVLLNQLCKSLDRPVPTHETIVPSPINNGLKSNEDYSSLINLHSPKMFNCDLTPFTLFGFWLPPRRRDIFDLQISTEDLPNGNYYNQTTNTFTFNDYKTAKTYGTQKFTLTSLKSLYSNADIMNSITLYLNNLPTGRLFQNQTENYLATKYREANEINIDETRHMWSKYGLNLSQENHRLLCDWMAHSYETNLAIYRP